MEQKEQTMNSLNEAVKNVFLEEYITYMQSGGVWNLGTNDELKDELNNMLQESGALVAGGFLTRCANIAQLGLVHDESDSSGRGKIMREADIDIYVPCENLQRVTDFFDREFEIVNINTVKAYDQSFFRKNNIMQRFHYEAKSYSEQSIDIMSIKKGTSPLDVVQNFDLTFCEIWYDGESINATNLPDAAQKKGFLRSDYVKALLDFNNSFIRERMERYRERGYTIVFQLDNMSNLPFAAFKSRKSISDMQGWLYLAIYHSMCTKSLEEPGEENKFWKISEHSSDQYIGNEQWRHRERLLQWQIDNALCNYDDINNICKRMMYKPAVRLAADVLHQEAVRAWDAEKGDKEEAEDALRFVNDIKPLLDDDLKLFQLLIMTRATIPSSKGFNLLLFVEEILNNEIMAEAAGDKKQSLRRLQYKSVIEAYFMMGADDLNSLYNMISNEDYTITLDAAHVDVPLYMASLPVAKQGETYVLDVFRSLIIPNDTSILNLNSKVDCDVGEPLPASENIHNVENPVQVLVKEGNSLVIDTAGGKPYIFCAVELRQYLISVREYDPFGLGRILDVHEMGQTGEPLQQFRNPISTKKIVAVRFMTQNEIDEAKREYMALEKRKSRIDEEQTALNKLMLSAQQRAMRSANRNRIRASMSMTSPTSSPLRRYLVQKPCMNDDDVDQILDWDSDGDPTDEQLRNLTEECRRVAREIARVQAQERSAAADTEETKSSAAAKVVAAQPAP